MENISKLKKIRLEKGYTQEDLLKKMENLSLRTLTRVEKDPLGCNLKTAKEIADALDMTIDELFFN